MPEPAPPWLKCSRVPEIAPSWLECPRVPELAPPWLKCPIVPEPAHEIDESAGLLPHEPPGVWRRATWRRLHARTWERPMRVLEVDLAHGYAVDWRREAWMRELALRPSPCRQPAVLCLQAASEPMPGAWMNASSDPSVVPAGQRRHDPFVDQPSADRCALY